MITAFRNSSRLGLAAAFFVALAAGCTEFNFDLNKGIPWGAGKDGELAAPMKVVAVWTDTVMSQGMAASTRGFGGRLMFYAVDGGKPVKVRGTLIVYAFDETGRDVEATKPDRKYVFTPEQFEKHYSKSPLGHSYSVWLPWDAAGGPLREISLVVKFQPENGAGVIGEPAKQHLPGARESNPTLLLDQAASRAAPAPGALAAAAANSQAVQLANYEQSNNDATRTAYSEPSPTATNNARRMTTTTIALPNQPAQRRSSALTQAVRGDGRSLVGDATEAKPPQEERPGATPQAVALPGAAASAAPQTTSAHFGPSRLRPLGGPIARLERDHAPWGRPRLESPSAPPSSP